MSEGHRIIEISNSEISCCLELSKKMGLDLEPSSSVSLIGQYLLKNKKIVCVLTGKGISAKHNKV